MFMPLDKDVVFGMGQGYRRLMYCPKVRVLIHLLQRLLLKDSEKITL